MDIDGLIAALCDNYCKYADTLEQDELYNKCEECPLNKIVSAFEDALRNTAGG